MSTSVWDQATTSNTPSQPTGSVWDQAAANPNGGGQTTQPTQTAPVQPYDPKVHGEYTTPENYTAWSNQPTDSNNPAVANKDWKFGERAAVEEAHGSAAQDANSAIKLNNTAVATGAGVGAGAVLLPEAGPLLEHISGQILQHGTDLATKYPNFVKLAGKLVPGIPLSTVAALTYVYEKLKK